MPSSAPCHVPWDRGSSCTSHAPHLVLQLIKYQSVQSKVRLVYNRDMQRSLSKDIVFPSAKVCNMDGSVGGCPQTLTPHPLRDAVLGIQSHSLAMQGIGALEVKASPLSALTPGCCCLPDPVCL